MHARTHFPPNTPLKSKLRGNFWEHLEQGYPISLVLQTDSSSGFSDGGWNVFVNAT